MVTVKVAILDDEEKDLLHIKNYFENVSSDCKYECDLYTNVNERFYKDYDLYILDIELPCLNGLDVGKEIRKVNPQAVLIMNSKREDLVFESFKFGIFFFVRKEHFEVDINYALERLNQHFISIKKYYKYETKHQLISIPYTSIMYVEKVKNGIDIVCENQTYFENKNLKDIIGEIQDASFIQCHQSYYVNLNHVDKLDNNDFIIKGKKVQISRRYYKNVKQEYVYFLNRKL